MKLPPNSLNKLALVTPKVNEPKAKIGPKPQRSRVLQSPSQMLNKPIPKELGSFVGKIADHFLMVGKTGLAKWQIENVVRNYIVTKGVEVILDQDFQVMGELIRLKELGGMPGTNVRVSSKSVSPDRSRSVEVASDRSKERQSNLDPKQPGVAKLPELKKSRAEKLQTNLLNLRISKSILKEIYDRKHVPKKQLLQEIQEKRKVSSNLDRYQSIMHTQQRQNSNDYSDPQQALPERSKVTFSQDQQHPYTPQTLSQQQLPSVHEKSPLNLSSIMINSPISKSRQKRATRASLMEYGHAAGCGSIDSALTKSKQQRQHRLQKEQNTAARYKSSLDKVFVDESLSPGKQPQKFTTLDSADPKNMKLRAYESRKAHRILNPKQAPHQLFTNDVMQAYNPNTPKASPNGKLQFSMQSPVGFVTTKGILDTRHNHDPTTFKPLISQDHPHLIETIDREPKFRLYQKDKYSFNELETEQINRFEDQDQAIQSLDAAMTPFMKNHNSHMQRMAASVARQERIQREYQRNAVNLPNQARYEQMKDEQFDKLFTKQRSKNDFSHQSHLLNEDMRRRTEVNANREDLRKQIKDREQERRLQRGLEKDLQMKQEHQIMIEQRKLLEKQLIEGYNMGEARRKESETRAQRSNRRQEVINMVGVGSRDYMQSHIS